MSGTAGAFAPPIPHPDTSMQTAPIGLNTGITSGNTQGNPLPMPGQHDSATVRGVKDLARDAGARDATLPSNDPDYDSRERMSPDEWHQRVMAAPQRPAGGPSDTQNANAQWGGDAKPTRGVKDLARDAGAVPDTNTGAPVPNIADKPKSAVTTTPDAKPGSVAALARAAGAR